MAACHELVTWISWEKTGPYESPGMPTIIGPVGDRNKVDAGSFEPTKDLGLPPT